MRRSLKSRRSRLPIPAVCAVAQQHENEPATVLCHRSLLCRRCHRCVAHCQCVPTSQPKPPAQKLRRGEVCDDQLALCERPQLDYAGPLFDDLPPW